MRGYEIFQACDRHSVETLSKHVAEYKYVYAEIDGLISQQFQGRHFKITWVNSILVAKPVIFFNILPAISPQVTSSWAIVFLELSVRIPLS